MILYGTGDPIEALDVLGPRIFLSTAKMAIGPQTMPGALGKERPLGKGAVGIERFLAKLQEIGFTGPLNIEREAENQEERMIDIAQGIELLNRLKEGGQ